MRILITLLSLFLFACNPAYYSNKQGVQLANEVTFQLITDIPFDDGLSLLQTAQISFNDQNHDLLFKTEISSQRLVLVGLTPTGTRLFSIQMDEDQITAQGLPDSEHIKPYYILADLQLSLWTTHLISSALDGATVLHQGPLQRIIMRNDQPIIMINYSNPVYYQGNIHFQHLERGYSLRIEPLSIEVPNHAE